MAFFSVVILFSALVLTAGIPTLRNRKHERGNVLLRNSYNYNLRSLAKESQLWPNGTVIYKFFRMSNSTKDIILAGMTEITKATKGCITFKEEQDEKRKSGLIFMQENLGGCYSQVGYDPKKEYQILMLTFGKRQRSCAPESKNTRGIFIHELMHVLGFLHEFQRQDRDQYIKFDKQAVQAATGYTDQQYELNFGFKEDDTKNVPFNFRSITNYYFHNYATEVENHPKAYGTLKNLGQLCAISKGDLELIEQTYYQSCRKNKVPLNYTKSYKIPGSDCRNRLEPDNDEVTSES